MTSACDGKGLVLSVVDRNAVIETAGRLAWCIDERRWAELAPLFTDPFEIDYTSIFGGRPATVTPAQMVANSERLIGNLTATQHLIGSFLVEGHGDQAMCLSMVQATHYLATRTGDGTWTVGAQYHMEMRRETGAWRINSLRAVLQWATGNREIMRLGKLPI